MNLTSQCYVLFCVRNTNSVTLKHLLLLENPNDSELCECITTVETTNVPAIQHLPSEEFNSEQNCLFMCLECFKILI